MKIPFTQFKHPLFWAYSKDYGSFIVMWEDIDNDIHYIEHNPENYPSLFLGTYDDKKEALEFAVDIESDGWEITDNDFDEKEWESAKLKRDI